MKRALFEILFPNKCPSCLKILDEPGFCQDCKKLVRRVCGPCCSVCARQIQYCECRGLSSEYKKAVSVFYYEGPVREAVQNMKFHRDGGALRFFAAEMVKRFNEELSNERFDIITGVPDFYKKRRRNGYCTAELLAKIISRKIGVEFCRTAVKKVIDNPPQHKTDAFCREGNVAGVFEADAERVAGKRVLLIDDVITTGATADAVSKMLMIRGAQSVTVLTAAVSPPHIKTKGIDF